MSDTTKVRIGFQGARELALEVDDASSISDTIEDAVAADDGMVWITDSRGHRYGLVVEKLAFLEVETESGRSGIGFSPGD